MYIGGLDHQIALSPLKVLCPSFQHKLHAWFDSLFPVLGKDPHTFQILDMESVLHLELLKCSTSIGVIDAIGEVD